MGVPLLFKDKLRAVRGKRSQSNAAAFLGVPVGTYFAWEQGRHKPSEFTQRLSLRALGGEFLKKKPRKKEQGRHKPDKMLRQILVRKLREG